MPVQASGGRQTKAGVSTCFCKGCFRTERHGNGSGPTSSLQSTSRAAVVCLLEPMDKQTEVQGQCACCQMAKLLFSRNKSPAFLLWTGQILNARYSLLLLSSCTFLYASAAIIPALLRSDFPRITIIKKSWHNQCGGVLYFCVSRATCRPPLLHNQFKNGIKNLKKLLFYS